MALAGVGAAGRQSGSPRFDDTGAASLSELVLVLATLGVLILLALPAASRLHDHWSLYCGAFTVESALQWGRLQAVSANASLVFEAIADGTAIRWRDLETDQVYEGSLRVLPQGVRIAASPAHPLRFFPQGNAAPAGSYVVMGDRGSYRVVVNIAGRIRVEKL